MDDTLKIHIQAEIQEALNKLTQLNQTLNGTEKEAQEATKQIKSMSAVDLWAGFQMAKGAITGVIGSLNEFVQSANSYSISMKGLSETAKAFGQDQQKANDYAKQLSSDGLMSVSQSAETLKMLLGSGFNIDEAFQMAKSMKDIGAFNNVVGDLGQAMVDASKGMKTGSIELIENIGLTQKLSTVMDQAGISTKNGINITTDAAQRQAVLNMVLAEGNKFQGNAAQLAKEGAGAYAQLGTMWDQLKVQIGETLNTVFIPLVIKLTEAVAFLKDHLPLAAGIAAGAVVAMVAPTIALTGSIAALGSAITAATGGLNLLIAAGVAVGVAGVAYVATMESEEQATLKTAKAVDQLTKLKQDYAKNEADYVSRVKAATESLKSEDEKRLSDARAKLENMKKLREEYKKYDTLENADPARLAEIKQLDDNIAAARQQLADTLAAIDKKAAERQEKQFKKSYGVSSKEWKEMLDGKERQHRLHLNAIDNMEEERQKKEKKNALEDMKVDTEVYKNEHNLRAKSAKEIIEEQEAEEKLKFAGAQTAISNMMSVTSQLATQNEALFRMNQGMGIANATMSAIESANKNLAAYPAPFGAIAAATSYAAGIANVGMIASQKFTPVEDFIYSERDGLIKFRKDDLVIGGTNLGGVGGGSDNSSVVREIRTLTQTLRRKPLSVSVNPLTGEKVYQQNLKGQRSIASRRVMS
jgi:hypothetical protein